MKIGVIGGSGMYDASFLENSKEIKAKSDFGAPSSPIMSGSIKGIDVVVIPRHGRGHVLNPTQVNYRANIDALKKLGVERIIAPCAVGSLKEQIKPGDLVFSDQFIDRTTKRASTFYESGKVCHIGVADPFCRDIRNALAGIAKKLKLSHHKSGTNIVIEGPRFSTRAESNLFRSWGADTINMTMVPESVLAREAEICYAPVAQVTDYDVWKDHAVTTEEILSTLKKNVESTKQLLKEVIPIIAQKRDCECNSALKYAFV